MLAIGILLIPIGSARTQAQNQRPNIILIVSDDFGYGDSGPYGGGENRGMPTPSLDRLAAEGMTFLSFYAQPSCTPGRAAMQTGRIPNRSGMNLTDMAKDAVGLMDRLAIGKAHVVGASMGGMIAQIVAGQYPERVRSLVSVMSSSGDPKLPQAKPEAMSAIMQPRPPGSDREIGGPARHEDL
jgi:pimeloyl-ACP methyl ester carboxylesterase